MVKIKDFTLASKNLMGHVLPRALNTSPMIVQYVIKNFSYRIVLNFESITLAEAD